MLVRTIKNVNLYKIWDQEIGSIFYGCQQAWYHTLWQRRAGCGPTVASNVIYYLDRTRRNFYGSDDVFLTKREAQLIMEKVYKYVTPTMRGIPSTELFYDDVLNYSNAMGMGLELGVFNVPSDRVSCPPFKYLLEFLDQALTNDTPVAFLNLDHGEEKRLDSWHWVTIISLEYELEERMAVIKILDEGTIKEIDLYKWFRTTTLGGGFVSFNL